MKNAVFAMLLLLPVTTDVVAQQWPQWRGPAASGVSTETGLPVTWSDTENIAWKAPIEAAGVSSPIVWGDLVVVTGQRGTGEVRQGPRLAQGADAATGAERSLGRVNAPASDGVTFVVSAFNRVSGRPMWMRSIRAQEPLVAVHDKHNLSSPSPVTDGERIYAWFATGQVVALDLQGKLLWERHLGKEYGPFEINWGHSSSPVIHRDQLLLLCYHERASYLLSLDPRTGATRWKADAPAGVTSYSTPLVIDDAGQQEIIVNSSAGVSGHDLSTGARLWQIDENNRFPVPMPLSYEGVIYTSRGYRSSPYLAIRPGGRGNVADSHVPWRVPSGAPYISSLVHYDGLLYMMGDVGVLAVVDAKSGERLHQERLGGVYTASPVAGDQKIYLVSEDGETIVLAAGRTPRVLARNRLNARQLASPAIAGGRLFIRSDDTLFAIGK